MLAGPVARFTLVSFHALGLAAAYTAERHQRREFVAQRLLDAERQRTAEALEREQATASVLRVIASAPSDLQPVLDAVVERAVALCPGSEALIHLLEDDVLRTVAWKGDQLDAFAVRYRAAGKSLPTYRPDPSTPSGRAIAEHRTVHVPDLLTAGDEFPGARTAQRELGHRTMVSVPLLREGEPIGVLVLTRFEGRPLTTEQIATLETFADQAVVVVENTRLFNELVAEREKSERLLLNVLPASIAARLKAGEDPIADGYDGATVVFADLVGSTDLTRRSDPAAFVGVLNELFSSFNRLAEERGIELTRTIGDGYMAVSGVPTRCLRAEAAPCPRARA